MRTDGIIELAVPQDVIDFAEHERAHPDLHPRNSITNGGRNTVAVIGEVMVAIYTGAVRVNTTDHDLLLGKIRIDVKTKLAVCAWLNDECSVADFNTEQDCDLYAFARVRKPDLRVAWILGCLPRDIFYRDARFLRKGQVDGSNGFVVKADCYNVYHRDLLPLPEADRHL